MGSRPGTDLSISVLVLWLLNSLGPGIRADTRMSMNDASHALTGDPGRDKQPARGRDGSDAAQYDTRTEQTNKPPNHGKSTRPDYVSTFLEWLHPGTPWEAELLQKKHEYFYTRTVADDRQPRDDPAPTWDSLAGWAE